MIAQYVNYASLTTGTYATERGNRVFAHVHSDSFCYKLVKEVTNKLELELENMVDECFDHASNMSSVNKALCVPNGRVLSSCNICALLWSLVKFGTARHHYNSGTIAKYSRHNPEPVQFSRG